MTSHSHRSTLAPPSSTAFPRPPRRRALNPQTRAPRPSSSSSTPRLDRSRVHTRATIARNCPRARRLAHTARAPPITRGHRPSRDESTAAGARGPSARLGVAHTRVRAPLAARAPRRDRVTDALALTARARPRRVRDVVWRRAVVRARAGRDDVTWTRPPPSRRVVTRRIDGCETPNRNLRFRRVEGVDARAEDATRARGWRRDARGRRARATSRRAGETRALGDEDDARERVDRENRRR